MLEAAFGFDDGPTAPSIGDRIEVHWSPDGTYYRRRVYTLSEALHVITYDDGNAGTLDLTREIWRFCAAFISETASLVLLTYMPSVLGYMLYLFGNKKFMLCEGQDIPPCASANAYDTVMEAFTKTVSVLHVSSIPWDAKTISTHVIYKVRSLTTSRLL